MNPPANTPPRLRPNGPLLDVRGLGHLFTARLAKSPIAPAVAVPAHGKVPVRAGKVYTPNVPGGPIGAGGNIGKKAALTTPLSLALAMQRFVQHRKSHRKDWMFGNKKYATNLGAFISVMCQNRNPAKCSGNKILFPGGWPTDIPYMNRDVNPGCSASLAALFHIFYGAALGPYPATAYTRDSSLKIAREASRTLTEARGGRPFPAKAGRTIFPSSSCPCLNSELACKAAKNVCSWIPGVHAVFAAGCVPTNPFAVAAAGVPNSGAGFPGVKDFAGERYRRNHPRPRRAKSTYVRQRKTWHHAKQIWWRRPSPPAGLPSVDL